MHDILVAISDGISQLFNIIFHLDQHLVVWVQYFGSYIYLILFLIIFSETGLVILPFLPGDSLLFAVGALTSFDGALDLSTILISLSLAAIIGDGVNYHIGKKVGIKVFQINSRFFKPDHLKQTQDFYHKWGPFTIVAARFAPIVRTFAPFVAGIGHMHYKKFLAYNVVGGLAWVFLFVLAGHFFGDLPFVKTNFHIVIFAVIFISILPMLIPWFKSKYQSKKA